MRTFRCAHVRDCLIGQDLPEISHFQNHLVILLGEYAEVVNAGGQMLSRDIEGLGARVQILAEPEKRLSEGIQQMNFSR